MLELSEDLKRRIATIYHEKYMLTPEQIKEQEELKQIRHKEQRQREEAVRMYLTDNCLMLSRYEEQIVDSYLPPPTPTQPHYFLNNFFQSPLYKPFTHQLTSTDLSSLLYQNHSLLLHQLLPQHPNPVAVPYYNPDNNQWYYNIGLFIHMGLGVWIPIRRFGRGGRFWINLDPSLGRGVERVGRRGLERYLERLRGILGDRYYEGGGGGIGSADEVEDVVVYEEEFENEGSGSGGDGMGTHDEAMVNAQRGEQNQRQQQQEAQQQQGHQQYHQHSAQKQGPHPIIATNHNNLVAQSWLENEQKLYNVMASPPSEFCDGIGVFKVMAPGGFMPPCAADEAFADDNLTWPVWEDVVEDEEDVMFDMDDLKL